MTNLEEFRRDTNPNNNGIDEDGLTNGDKVFFTLTDPLDPDSDKDPSLMIKISIHIYFFYPNRIYLLLSSTTVIILIVNHLLLRVQIFSFFVAIRDFKC